MKHKLKSLIKEAFATTAFSQESIVVEQPKQAKLGDYALPLAFSLAKRLKKAPPIIAKELVELLQEHSILKATVDFSIVGGFINLKFKDRVILEAINSFTKPFASPIRSSSVLLEYVSANPTGPLHIGHGRWAVLGDIYARILKANGQTVFQEFYINDAGVQIDHLKESVRAIRAGEPLPAEGYRGAYINALADCESDPVEVLLDQQNKVLSRLGLSFDQWFSEKSLHRSGAIDAVLKTLQNDIYESDAALWFKSTQYGDDKDRVLRKKEGSWTYFAVDLAYHFHKLERNYDKMINIWGADHHGYVPRMQAGIKAFKATNPSFKAELVVILGQLVSLYRDGEPVRMSKRTGDMIALDEVLDEIGIDATRYFLAEKSASTHLDFDLTVAKQKSMENPVYYLQYAHARFCRILENFSDIDHALSDSLNSAERSLLMQLLKYPDVINEVAESADVYHFVAYLNQLARLCHSFYESCPIINQDLKTQAHRLYIVDICKTFLAYAFEEIMGINAPRKM